MVVAGVVTPNEARRLLDITTFDDAGPVYLALPKGSR